MPTDQKRINGPEVTIPHVIYTENANTFEDKRKVLLNKSININLECKYYSIHIYF